VEITELFAGVGSQTQALKNLGVEHTCKISEIDKYAMKSYNAIHGETENLGDICVIENLPYSDMVTYSFPCQDLSVAGNQAGIKEGTRSGLLFEVERLIENMEVKPKFLLLENVKNLIGKRHRADYDRWLEKLEELGYNNYWQMLNAKNYGIPQNRERVFCLSIRKDIDNGYEFPKPQKLKLRLKDMLEDEVDEKYYISEEKTKLLVEQLNPKEYDCIDTKMPKNSKSELSKTILATCYKEPLQVVELKINQLGLLDIKGNERPEVLEELKIRKLTPLECWRLMGFKDEQFEKAEGVCSNSQLYKQAGNSIVVDVLEGIFEKMIEFRYIKKGVV